MKRCLLFLFMILTVIDGQAQKRKIIKALHQMEQELQDHSGFALYDPGQNKMLIEYQADRYFTPASNTKIFTMYTTFKVIGDKVPGLYYKIEGDSLIFWGTGDPSFLYTDVMKDRTVFDFLKSSDKQLYFSSTNFQENHFGPNWSWDDYLYRFQVERTPLPIYGNFFQLKKVKGENMLHINIPVFKRYFWAKDSSGTNPPIIRDYGSNLTDYFPQSKDSEFERNIPFRYSDYLLADLLSDTLKRSIGLIGYPLEDYQTLNSIPTDSLLKELMHSSDNFIAEQLLLTTAGVLSDTLKTSIAINYAKNNLLNDLPDKPLWFDGSGLSRYNQFTPRSIVFLWKKLLYEYGSERLFPLLATGGKYGTIRNYYKAEVPYIFGKTGTLRNNHSLSGYIKTDKGNVLIFSFMNSHYPGDSGDAKVHMENILKMIKSRY